MVANIVVASRVTEALRALRAAVGEAKQSDPMRAVTVLVPSNPVGLAVRRELAKGVNGQEGIAALTVTTLARLAEQIASADMQGRRPLTRAVLTTAYRRALGEGSSLFKNVADHPATLRALANAHRSIRKLSPSALAALPSANELTGEVVGLAEAVHQSLAADWYDTTDLLQVAQRQLGQEQTLNLGAVVLYQPRRLTAAEAELLRTISARAQLSVVLAHSGDRRADDAVAASLEAAGIFVPAGGGTQLPDCGTVLHASDADDEVRFVVRRVIQQLQTTRADRIAVLYSASVPYARLLHEHLAEAGIRVNGPGVAAVRERALPRALMSVLELNDRNWERVAVFGALSQTPVYNSKGERIPLARWERLARKAGIVEGADWEGLLTRFAHDARARATAEQEQAEPEQWRIDRTLRDADDADNLRDFLAHLRSSLEAGEGAPNWTALSEWALQLFHELWGDAGGQKTLPAAEQYAVVVIEQSVTALRELDGTGTTPSLAAARDVLDGDLEAARPRVGRFGEGVHVAPISHAVGLEFDAVFVLGLAEDLYPGRISPDPLLPDRARAATEGELLDSRTRIDELHAQLLSVLASAPIVVASFPRGDLRRSTPRLPSRWLLPSIRALANDPTLEATKWESARSPHIIGSESFWSETRRTSSPANDHEWRLRATGSGSPVRDSAIDAALELLHARAGDDFSRYDGNLAGTPDLPDHLSGHVAVSPTTLESYGKCPHAYFMKRMLGVDELEQPEAVVSIAANEIGNIVHNTMDRLVHEYADQLPEYGKPWTDEQRERFRAIAREVADDAEGRGLTGHTLLWQRERENILRDLDLMLDEDDRYRKERNARVLGSELAFGLRGKPPLPVEVPGGRILMKGSADRVDETSEGVLIVTDIKTGRKTDFMNIAKDAVVAGTKLQLPVYALAAQQEYGNDKVEAAYWFVRRDKDRIPVTLDEDLRVRYAETLVTIASSIVEGLFPAKAPTDPDYLFRQCAWCNPDGLGHSDVRAQYERKRSHSSLEGLIALIDPEASAGEDDDDQ